MYLTHICLLSVFGLLFVLNISCISATSFISYSFVCSVRLRFCFCWIYHMLVQLLLVVIFHKNMVNAAWIVLTSMLHFNYWVTSACKTIKLWHSLVYCKLYQILNFHGTQERSHNLEYVNIVLVNGFVGASIMAKISVFFVLPIFHYKLI